MTEGDEEAQMEIDRMRIDIERKYRWHVSHYGDRIIVFPDTTHALGHDIFGVKTLKGRPIQPDDLVHAFPEDCISNWTLREMKTITCRYSDVPQGYLIETWVRVIESAS
jgi:hypothetical protein